MRRDFSLAPVGRSGRPRRPIDIAMTPMIDVIFLLLVFFLATSTFDLVERMLPSAVSQMPEPSGSGVDAPPPEPTQDALEQVVIKLQMLGPRTTILLNGGELANMSELQQQLRAISSVQADVPVVIDPDAEVAAADVVNAYDLARQSGLVRVYLATRQP